MDRLILLASPIPFSRSSIVSEAFFIQRCDCFRRIIYSDSHGTAYKARFPNGETALVKEVKDLHLGDDVFAMEVELLGRLHHRHLLGLKGFSIGHKRLLVFDNIENGSLKEHLNDPLRTHLNWKTRSQIAVGVAAALLSNVVLFSQDGNYTSITQGATAEECLDGKNILYELGVVLLELITGQFIREGKHRLNPMDPRISFPQFNADDDRP